MPQPIKVLMAEDNPADAELILRELRRAGFEPDWQRVDTEAEFREQLHDGLDLVLSDYDMPQFTGFRALELLKESGLEVPFILISGTIGEDMAVQAMKQGTTDYLLKDRLTRLGPAVSHALEQSRLRRARGRTERALMESERRFREMLENAALIAVTLDKGALVTFCNDYLLRLTGWRREEVVGGDWFEKFIPDSSPELRRMFFGTLADGTVPQHHENPIKTRGGGLRLIAWNNTMLRDGAGNIIGTASIGEDVTDRKQAEEALRASEERFRQLAENIKEVFWMTDPAKNEVLYISPAYEAVWGRTCESLYQTPRNWVEAIHPDDRKRVEEAAAARQASGTYDETYRIVRPDGSLRWVRDRAYPIYNAAGQVYRIVGTAEDISSQKEMEVQVMRMQRMESVGRMASGIAHDLNNILAPILMGAPLMRMGLPPGQMERTLTTIEASARRGADLVKQLLMFGRGVEGRRMLVRLNDLVREMEEITGQTFPRNIAIAIEVPGDLWPVMGDATQLHQVLLNLCVNARDAMPQGGTLTIAAKNIRIDQSYVSMSPEARPGAYACVAVTDTGTGIPPAVLDKIFDPFFTTKEVGKGTGLGLSTLSGIVKNHGGFVTVESELGKGSTFRVYLPGEPGAREAPAAPDATLASRGHGEMILVVDDEANIRDITGKILEHHGYRVQAAGDGAEACAQFARHLAAIEMVLTDIDMPVMGGVAMIQVLKRMKPAIKIIISSGKTSGMGNKISRTAIDDLKVDAILTKPYTAEKILQVVHEVLARKPA